MTKNIIVGEITAGKDADYDSAWVVQLPGYETVFGLSSWDDAWDFVMNVGRSGLGAAITLSMSSLEFHAPNPE